MTTTHPLPTASPGDPPSREDSARQGFRMLPEFVSAMSHELRSPLNAILGYEDLLRDHTFGPLNASQEDALERIRDNAYVLLERLNSVLDFTRLQAGHVEIFLHEISADDVIASIASNLRPLTAPKAAAVAFEVATVDGLPSLHTDPELLVTALRHIAWNAFKFTEKGAITLDARRVDDGVEFRVSDAGRGIPSDQIEAIFAPFHKVDGGGEKGFRDLGLGLYIARGYVERLGGSITVESALGHGSTFRIWIPARAPVE